MTDTGKTIRQLRMQAGFSQKTLAKALQITDKAISKWERGICLPDVTLLPKLSMLLDADLEILVSKSLEQEDWVGVIDIETVDFAQIVYDKPLVYYLLSHFLLLGIKTVYVLTSEANQRYLSSQRFGTLGLTFQFRPPDRGNYMILDHPWFLFGSNLTQQFQGVMMSQRMIKLVPENQEPVFYFAHNCESYDRSRILRSANPRTLGRGMICFDMNDCGSVLDVASFVRTYQKNSGLLIGSLEEIAYTRGLITEAQLLEAVGREAYGTVMKRVRGKPQVDCVFARGPI